MEGLTTDFQDIWAVAVGARIPVRPRWEVRGGLLYLSEAIKDENRTFALRLDEVWGIGGGFRYSRGPRQRLTLNLNYIDAGDAPVETPDLPLVGQVTGEYTTRRTTMLDFAYSWRIEAPAL